MNRLQVLETVKVDAGVETLLTKFEYDLDDVGHRLEVKETLRQPDDSLLERTVKYEYDNLYRLTSEEVVGGDKITFTYDDVGNRASQTVNGVTTTYVYDDNDRLLQELIDGVVVVSYTYDANGNTTSRTKDGVTINYIWDDQNRLVEVQTPDGTVNYAYDDENIRVSETVDGITTSYLLDKNRPYGQVLAEYVDGVLDTSYTYGLDLIEQERDGDESYYSVDGLGSTRGLTDENGEVTDSYVYDAFGNLIGSNGETENDYLFAGEQFDETLGQYYFRQRYYEPTTGRFTRRDTYEGRQGEPITLNKYVYGNANPVSYTDPTGLFGLAEFSAAESIRNTLASMQIDFGFEAVNILLGGDGPSAASIGFDLAMSALPLVGALNIPLPKIRKGTATYKRLKNTRERIDYAIEAGKRSLKKGEPYSKTISGRLSESEANHLGIEFIGENFWQNPDNLGEFYSADNLKRYRSAKSKKYSTYSNTGVQANFEVRPNVNTDWKQAINIHVDIKQ